MRISLCGARRLRVEEQSHSENALPLPDPLLPLRLEDRESIPLDWIAPLTQRAMLGASFGSRFYAPTRTQERKTSCRPVRGIGCEIERARPHHDHRLGGPAPSSRLADGPVALPPKSEVIFERTLNRGCWGIRSKWPNGMSLCLKNGDVRLQRTHADF